MIRIQQLKLDTTHTEAELKQLILKKLKIKSSEIISYEIVRKSIDARKKPILKFVYTVDVRVIDQERTVHFAKNPSIQIVEKKEYKIPESGSDALANRPIIAGFGPAGMFCALLLARAGYRPIVLERGADIDERQKKVNTFWKDGILDKQSNVQFGEGGAGTFSDGKLNTAVKDPAGRNRYVLSSFVNAGAPEEILWLGKPHIGTDILSDVVKNIRKEICSLGGEVRFKSQVTDLTIRSGEIISVEVNSSEMIPCQAFVIATGHSARDTFEMLQTKPLSIKAKSFAVGVRIEHPQEMIDLCQYGKTRTDELSAADYKLTKQLSNGRGVYSFCMCPGGYVVNASSEAGMTAVNGMSYHDRAGANANSAMVVTVSPKDFGSDDPLSGVAFQRNLEKLAYQEGQGKVPVQLFEDFSKKRSSVRFGDITPQIKGDYIFGNLHECFPDSVYQSLKDGISQCGDIISGFARADAVLSGVESRTSSPIRIERGTDFESSIAGVYPCGEGAGYAGGIMSAAMDGLKIAETVIKKYALSNKDRI